MNASDAVMWIATFLFLLLLVGMVLGEIFWLKKKGWATTGKAAGFVLSTDILSMIIGSIVAGIAFFIMFMMVMGPAGRGGDSPEWAYWVMTAVAILAPSIFLIFAKRAGLAIFGIRSGGSAWVYSFVVSLIVLIVVLVPPPLFFYIAATISSWKM